MNICMKESLWAFVLFLLGRYLEMKLLGGIIVSTFWETGKLFCKVDAPFYILASTVSRFSFLHILLMFVIASHLLEPFCGC